jgi:hypothetical protein
MFSVNENDARYWNETLTRLIHEDRFVRTLLFARPKPFYCPETNLGDIDVFAGASKMVFISRHSEVAVKVNLSNEDKYCEIEVDNYTSAVQSNLDKCFAGVIPGGILRTETEVSSEDIFDICHFYRLDVQQWRREKIYNYAAVEKEFYHKYRLNKGMNKVSVHFSFYFAEKMELSFRDANGSYDYYSSSYSGNETDEDDICESTCNGTIDQNWVESYKEYLSRRIQCSHDLVPLSDRVGAVFLGQYGEDVLNQLTAFIKDNQIDDLHDGNIMYDKEGKIRFIDYSGYFG